MVLHIVMRGGYRDLVGDLGEEVACPGEREPRISKLPSTGVKAKMEPFPIFSRQLSPLLSSILKPSEDPLCPLTQFRLFFFKPQGPPCPAFLISHSMYILNMTTDQPTSLRWSHLDAFLKTGSSSSKAHLPQHHQIPD